MKILDLDLRAFGPFTDVRLDLSAGDQGLHLIYGPNEAGKSTALRALRQMLFGIPAQTPDDFLHKYKDMLVGATLRDGAAPDLRFLRRKANVRTLLGEDAKTFLDDSALSPFLGGVTLEQFHRLFSLDHETLVAGGRAIVAGGGDMGDSLFAAGAGIACLGQVRKDLESRARELFLPEGRTGPAINKVLAELRKAREARKAAALRSEEWETHDRQRQAAAEQKGQVERAIDDLRSRANRLTRIRDALPAIATRKGLLADWQPLADAVVLPAGFGDRYGAAMEGLRLAEDRARRLEPALAEARRKLDGLDVPEELLAQSDAIEALYQELRAQQKAARERTKKGAEREQFLADAEAILADLQPGCALADAARLRLGAADRVRAQNLGHSHQAWEVARKIAREREKALTAQVAGARRALEAHASARDPEALQRAASRARRQGDLEAARTTAQGDLKKADRRGSVGLRKLGLWSGSLEDLESLPIPSFETIDRSREQHDDGDRDLRALRAQVDGQEAEARRIVLEIDRLRSAGAVPTAADLERARGRRDAGWRLVLDAWIDGRPDGPEVQAFAATSGPAASLPVAYERSVAEADAVADRLRNEAGRVEAHLRLLADRAACEQDLERLNRLLAAADSRVLALREDWSARWQPLGITPLSPKEMAAWARAQEELRKQAADRRELAGRIEDLDRQIEESRREVSEALGRLGEAGARGDESLSALLARADGVVETIKGVAAERRQFGERLAGLEDELLSAQEQDRKAEEDLDRWRTKWADAMAPLGLAAEATPAEAGAVIDRMNALFEKLDKAEGHRRAIEAIEQDTGRFASAVAVLAGCIAPGLAGPPEPVAAELHRRLVAAREVRQDRDSTRALRDQQTAEREAALFSAAESRTRLDEMGREAGGAAVEEIPEVLRRSDRRRALDERLRDVEEELLRSAGGSALADFLALAEAEDPDALGPTIEGLHREIEDLDAQKGAQNQAIGREGQWLSAHDGGAAAAEADELVEDLRARVEADVAQYVPIRLAMTVLDQVIARYREKNQGTVFARAGALFARLTGGSFAGLDAELDDRGRYVLAGIRNDGKGRVGVEGLSEGTADQLYLALRLAILDAHLDAHPLGRLPLTIDDLLINFDNERAIAALRVLAEVSRRIQVLFFTHHEHLLELAREHLDAGVLFTHRLGDRG